MLHIGEEVKTQATEKSMKDCSILETRNININEVGVHYCSHKIVWIQK